MVDFDELLKKKRAKAKLNIGPDGISQKDSAEDLESLMDQCRKVSDLEKIWHRAVEGYTQPLTMKDRIHLKHWATRCGGYPNAAFVLVWAVRNWHTYARDPRPKLRFILSRSEDLINAALEEHTPHEAAPPRPKKKKVIKPKGF